MSATHVCIRLALYPRKLVAVHIISPPFWALHHLRLLCPLHCLSCNPIITEKQIEQSGNEHKMWQRKARMEARAAGRQGGLAEQACNQRGRSDGLRGRLPEVVNIGGGVDGAEGEGSRGAAGWAGHTLSRYMLVFSLPGEWT